MEWIGQLFIRGFEALILGPLAAMLPDLLSALVGVAVPESDGSLRVIMEWLTMLDQWFATVLMLKCALAYLQFRIAFVQAKLTLKFIPFIG